MTEFLNFKIFHNKKGFMRIYHSIKKKSYEPVKDWMLQTMIMYLITDEFDIDGYKEEKLILDYFFLHEYNERSVIWEFWREQWLKVLLHPLKADVDLEAVRPHTQIALYHNVKTAFYFAFQSN